jgi:hypothetical protein
MQQTTTTLAVDDKISYTDKGRVRTGIIIEIDDKHQVARIKWDGRNMRTWIRFAALVVTAKAKTATIHVDGQPEEFDTSIPNVSPFCLIAAWSSVIAAPRYYSTEGEAAIAYDAEVKVHRDTLAANSQYKFNVSLFSGSTLLRKTSK